MTIDLVPAAIVMLGGGISGTASTLAMANGTSAVIAAVVGATGTIVAAILITRRSAKQQLNSIEVKVDGRLEAALEQMDRSAGIIASLTGTQAPPLVAGQNVPGSTPTTPAQVLAEAAAKAKTILDTAAEHARVLLAEATNEPPPT